MGHPIGHSKSPALHNAAYTALELDYTYTAIDVQKFEFAPFLARVRTESSWYGLSVTMPLKNSAAALADDLTDAARALGAANTLVMTDGDDGVTHVLGDNTDVTGIINALIHAGVCARPRAAVLGGGGTAASAVAAFSVLGAIGVDVYVRNPEKAVALEDVAQNVGVEVRILRFDDAAQSLGGYDAVISTLPPHAGDPLAEKMLRSLESVAGACLLDVAYDPWPSALAQAWAHHGGTVVPGIEMLLYQGVEQAKLFVAAGGNADCMQGRTAEILNVMCNALGLARRPPHE